jgi:putative transposase
MASASPSRRPNKSGFNWSIIMPRSTIQWQQGQYYHLYNRGAGRQSIFLDDENYTYLLGLLKKVAAECEITVIAHCLLPNHYHWLIRQDGETPGNELPKRVFGSYTQAFNRRNRRSGTLFEGRFKPKLVSEDTYRLHLCRYIHANPVRHGIAFAPELWPYSNYQEWIGVRPGTLVDRAFIAERFPHEGQYQASVNDYIRGNTQIPEAIRRYLDTLP